MVFKRYIKKGGKKLGPYYYENVRHEGKIKTVYVGTNPQHHPKHKIKKPLFVLILALSLILIFGAGLFILQNKAYLTQKITKQEAAFDVDQILLKVLVRSSEFIEKELRVMNTGQDPSVFSLEVSGLQDLVKLDSSSFRLKPGQTKIITLNFSSVMPQEKIEQEPGIYIGKLLTKSEKATKEIPIVVEIETKNVLFDMNLNPVAIERKVKQGADTTIEVRLFNLESIESVNVDVEYFVKDVNGNTIMTESETVVVKTQASFFKTISIPKKLKPGPYIFAGKAKFGKSAGTSSYLFEVIGPESPGFVQFCKNSALCLALSLTTLLLLFALMAYVYFFIGAYLYDKITGIKTLPRKKEQTQEATETIEEEPEIGFISRLLLRLKLWRKEREKKKAERKKSSEEKKLQKLAEEKRIQLEAEKKQAEIDRMAQEKLRREQEWIRQKEFERQRREEERKKHEELKRKQQELEAKKAEEEKRKKETQRKKLRRARRKEFREFLHNIGLYKTPEERKKIAIQKEKEGQERLKRESEERKLRELEKKKGEEERKKQIELQRNLEEERLKRESEERKGIEIERRKVEAQRKMQEEIERKQKELEEKKRAEGLRKQQIEEEKRRKEELKKRKELEEERRKQEAEKKKGELEKRKEEELKIQKTAVIKELETKLNKLKESIKKLNSELKNLESERKNISNRANDIDAELMPIEHDVINKSKEYDDIKRQKKSLNEKYSTQLAELEKKELEERKTRSSRIKELKAKLLDKEDALLGELEHELRKLSPEKRKKTEKWKRLEIKAKLKLEEHSLEEQVKKDEGKTPDERKQIEENYKNSSRDLNKNMAVLKQAIVDLESHKEHVLVEKKHSHPNLLTIEKKIEEIKKTIERAERSSAQLESELAKARAEIKPRLGILGSLFSLERPVKEKEEVKEKIKEEPKKEKKEKIELKTESELNKCYNKLHEANEALNKNNLENAKAFYISARNIYVKLSYEDKKKVYNELMEVYNRLLK